MGSKKLDLTIKRNLPHSKETADFSTLDSLQSELEILKESLEKIKRNVIKQKEIEEEHFNLGASVSSTQTGMSIFKMFIVISVCLLQVYFITGHFKG